MVETVVESAVNVLLIVFCLVATTAIDTDIERKADATRLSVAVCVIDEVIPFAVDRTLLVTAAA